MSVTNAVSNGSPGTDVGTQSGVETLAEDEAGPSEAALEALRVDDEETPIAQREAVAFEAVHAEGLDPTDYFNYVVLVERRTSDQSHTLYVRSYEPGPAACRGQDWGRDSDIWWAGDLEQARIWVYKQGHGLVEGPLPDGAWS